MNWQDRVAEAVADRPQLPNAPLKAVLAQAQVPEIISFNDELIRPIQVALSEAYPVLEREVAQELRISPVPKQGGGIMESTGRERVSYRFRDTEKTWAVAISPDSVSLENVVYPGMQEFARRWAEMAEAVSEALAIKAQTRLGLRYINELPCPGRGQREDLVGWVRDELIGVIGAQERRTSNVLRALTEARFAQPDGRICTMRYGVAPTDDDPERRAFLLDLDYFDPNEQGFDVEQQVRALGQFNDGNHELFEWAFPEGTRAGFAAKEGDSRA